MFRLLKWLSCLGVLVLVVLSFYENTLDPIVRDRNKYPEDITFTEVLCEINNLDPNNIQIIEHVSRDSNGHPIQGSKVYALEYAPILFWQKDGYLFVYDADKQTCMMANVVENKGRSYVLGSAFIVIKPFSDPYARVIHQNRGGNVDN